MIAALNNIEFVLIFAIICFGIFAVFSINNDAKIVKFSNFMLGIGLGLFALAFIVNP